MLSHDLSFYHDQLYASNVATLLSIVGDIMKHSVAKQPSNYPPDFLAEWAELHALSIYNTLLPYYVTVSGEKMLYLIHY